MERGYKKNERKRRERRRRKEGKKKENQWKGAEEGRKEEKEETGFVGKAALNSFLSPALARNMTYLTRSTC